MGGMKNPTGGSGGRLRRCLAACREQAADRPRLASLGFTKLQCCLCVGIMGYDVGVALGKLKWLWETGL